MPTGIASPNFCHVGGREFGLRMEFSAMERRARRSGPALPGLIKHVFLMGPKEPVPTVATGRVVAGMTHEHPGRDWPDEQLPSGSVGASSALSLEGEVSVSAWRLTRSPRMACVRAATCVNVREPSSPVAFWRRCRSRHEISIPLPRFIFTGSFPEERTRKEPDRSGPNLALFQSLLGRRT